MDPLLCVPNADFDRASRRLREGNLEEAADIFAPHLRRRPAAPESVRHLGLIAHRIGNHERAAELISQAILIEPGLRRGLCRPGRRAAHARAARSSPSRPLETAIAMGHRTARAYTDLGDILGALGRP